MTTLDQCDLKPTDTLYSFKGEDGQYFKADKYRDAIETFRGKIREIITRYEKLSEHNGSELFLLLNRTFGYHSFGEIPWKDVDKVKQWVENNWFRAYQIRNPRGHMTLMESVNDYSTWFNECLAKVSKKTDYGPMYD